MIASSSVMFIENGTVENELELWIFVRGCSLFHAIETISTALNYVSVVG